MLEPLISLGRLDQFDASSFQQLAFSGVGDGFFLHGGVDHDLQSSFLGIGFKESAPSMVRAKSFPSLMYSLTARILSSYENMNYLHLVQVIVLTPRSGQSANFQLVGYIRALGIKLLKPSAC